MAACPTFTCPHFPSKGVVVTSWDNLSIYFQDSSWRRQIVENPKRSQVEDYNSRNEGYVIEQLGKFRGYRSRRRGVSYNHDEPGTCPQAAHA